MTDPIHLAKPERGIQEPGEYPPLACGADPKDAQWDTSLAHVTCEPCKDAEEDEFEDE